MSVVKEITEATGLNQGDIANYAGITRSLLAMYETGERMIPTEAFLKINQLWQWVQDAKQALAAAYAPSPAAIAKVEQLKSLAAAHRAKAYQLESFLPAQKNAALQPDILALVLNKTNTAPGDESDLLWAATMDVKKRNIIEQKKEQYYNNTWEVYRLKAMADAAERLAENIMNGMD